MKKNLWLLALSLMLPVSLFAQDASAELVSKRLVDAINSGKFYMKTGGSFRIDDGGEALFAEMQMETATKGEVTMNRVNTNGMQNVILSANGYNYMLDEAKKTYTPQATVDMQGSSSMDKLTFVRQGTCKLNGADYYYDEWKTASGDRFFFYYNSPKVAAIEMMGTSVGSEGKTGPMSLLSFKSSIPKNMYFCLGNEWKKGNASTSAMGGIDPTAFIPDNIEGMEDLPEGINIKDLMSGKVDQKALIQKYVKEEDLPEGMSMNDVMKMMGGTNLNDAMKHLTPEQKKIMQQQGVDLSALQNMGSQQAAAQKQAMQMQQQQQTMVANAPEPPRCSTPWTDNTQGMEMAAGIHLGELALSGKRPAPRDSYVYLADFQDAPASTSPRIDLNVTDEGVWLAFEEINKEIEQMSDEEALSYVDAISGDALTCAEVNLITGQMIERAIAACMIAPSSYTYNNAGMLFVHIADDKHALDYFKQAEKIDPENPAVLTNIADCYLASNNTAEVEKYVAKALMFAPDYGPALQMRTTLLLKQGKFEEAIKALFHCAAYYFSDVTASQFFSLMMQLQALESRMDGNNEENFKEVIDRLMSDENKALLKKATMAGFNKKPQAGQPDHRKFEFTYEVASIMHQHKSLEAMHDAFHNDWEALQKRSDELTRDNTLYQLYFTMGFGSFTQSMDALENELNKITAVQGQADVYQGDNLSFANNGYEMLCKTKGYEGGVSLLDARQFWCMMIWRSYYRLLMNWASGYLGDVQNDGTVLGSCPESYRNYHRVLHHWLELRPKADESYRECLKGSASPDEITTMRNILGCNRSYWSSYENPSTLNPHSARQQQYVKDIQPILEEYWATMSELAGYCNDATLQEYFLTEAMYDINALWPWGLREAARDGNNLAMWYKTQIIHYEAAIGQRISELKEEEAKKREAMKSKDARLKNYGEKDHPDYGFGINTPFGRIGFMQSDGQTNISFESKLTGKTTIKNLTTGNTTTMTTYKTLADEAREQAKKSPFDWLKDQGKDKLIDKVGKTALNTKDMSKFKAGFGQTRQHARTTDRMGNTVDTGDVHTRSFSIGGGDSPISATATETRHRSGNSFRVKNHLTVNFGTLDFTFGR